MSVSLNEFTVDIRPEFGHAKSVEKKSAHYVEMPGNNCKYAVRLRNDGSQRCDAYVTIDGQDVGAFRVNAYSHLELERPSHSDKQFTFFVGGTKESHQAGYAEGDAKNGLVKVVFKPEVKYISKCQDGPTFSLCAMSNESAMLSRGSTATKSYREGHSGLSGHSDQKFKNTSKLDYDYDKQTTIQFRLVATDEEEPDIVPIGTRAKTTEYPAPVGCDFP